MREEAWREFFQDEMTWKAYNKSEVFPKYVKAEMEREKTRKLAQLEEVLDAKIADQTQMEEVQIMVDNNPKLRQYLKLAKATLAERPELVPQVDPNFIKGLEQLDLDDEE